MIASSLFPSSRGGLHTRPQTVTDTTATDPTVTDRQCSFTLTRVQILQTFPSAIDLSAASQSLTAFGGGGTTQEPFVLLFNRLII